MQEKSLISLSRKANLSVLPTIVLVLYPTIITVGSQLHLETRNKAQQEKGFFVIATNDLEQNKFTLLQVLEVYNS
jgi:hypothetical protein